MHVSVAPFVLVMTTFALVTTVPELAIAQGLSDLAGVAGGSKTEAEPARTIAPTSSIEEDRALTKRLQEIFGQVDGLGGVAIEVRAGVVELSGEVFSAAAHEKATRIASQLLGVVEVQDMIEESRDIERRLRPVLSDLRERSIDLLTGIPLFAISLVVFGLFVVAGRLASRWDGLYRRLARNPFASDLARQAVRVGFVMIGVVVALEILDATAVVAAVAGIAGLAGLAVSFAFRDLAENYIASVLLSLRQPFQADEHVEIAGYEGRIVRLTSRATILLNLDGNHVRIPNATVFKASILNYTRNPQRRFGFDVGVANDVDLNAALGLGIATLESMPGVLAEPSPTGWVSTLGDWNVTLHFLAWIDQRETHWFKARGESMRVVKEAFDTAGIAMPEPAVTLLPPRASATDSKTTSEHDDSVGAQHRADTEVAEFDISSDHEIETAVAEDRAAGGLDLLDPTRPRE